jgi:hypothetical protein
VSETLTGTPVPQDIANISSFWLSQNDFSQCLTGTSDHFRVRVRSYDTLTVIPTVSPEDTPVPDSYFNGNVDWELDISYDDDPFSPYYQQVRAILRDWNLTTDPLNLPATDFDGTVNLMDTGSYNPSASDYSANHTLAGALIYHDNNPYDGSSDYLWIEINSDPMPVNRYGATRSCNGCFEVFSSNNSCSGAIPYVRITDPDPGDPSDACDGCTHGFQALYSETPSALNLYANFYRDSVETSANRLIAADNTFTDFLNSYTEALGFVHEYVVKVDLAPQGYNCTVHDVKVIAVLPTSTPSPSPTITTTPLPTATTTPTATPLCPFLPTEIEHLYASLISANQIEFYFKNNSLQPIGFEYWKFNAQLLASWPLRRIDLIEFKSGVGSYSTVWFLSAGVPQTNQILWTAPGIAGAGEPFNVRIRFRDAGSISPGQTLVYILGPECSWFWLGPHNLELSPITPTPTPTATP